LPTLSGAPAAASVPVAVNLPTPVDAPDFAHALGTQVSVLAKDGVQRAELHLNPADMGPVSVQIVMAGTQARVDFGADTAATRHALEAGMPELAIALRDAGFTLTGGGVSQHAGGRGGNDSGRPDGREAGAAAAQNERVTTPLRQRTGMSGGVDLYA
jgi:flagellar hook-length control protein FliK